ncbi:hypothetical protein CSV69_09685 [Sporosarcina sp. P26b]|uniref:protein NO VEIN domain-containing protein n=1 Tax=Sporosarcina sp. P26b TaxID=2048253 RepID=UPI000C166435|nr:DUF3883 domain-containing protein [Sporosarcina sp. P26b]PIC95786.1 hypothetical protein CSV69_09685 [Sporosarcina sp. P26b]
MKYNPEEQYRCIIIRGKASNKLDDLLPAYANIIDDICPCSKLEFIEEFNKRVTSLLGNGISKKTKDNHRSEIAGKLFGMYYEQDGIIIPSSRTMKYLDDSDQPAFFKDICFKFQFPNGMNKIDTIKDHIEKKLSIRQFPYVIKVLQISEEKRIRLTKDDIAYYVLNALNVLQGLVNPADVVERILYDRSMGLTMKVNYPTERSSYYMQHIREQLNLLELANILRFDGLYVYLNSLDEEYIKVFADFWNSKPEFDVYQYNLNTAIDKKRLYDDWQLYYAGLNETISFKTSLNSLRLQQTNKTEEFKVNGFDKMALGDEGENYVLTYEKDRVRKFDVRLSGKVVHLGKTRGLGYDIQSVVAENGEDSEFVKYIEVKSTKRVTVPKLDDPNWIDSINLTRNEWIAATQHRGSYFLYRVYFTPEKTLVYIIKDPYQKNVEGILRAKPISYRLDFSKNAVDFIVDEKEEYN